MNNAVQKRKDPASDVITMLQGEALQKQIALALPKHLTPTRMARIAITEIRKNPKLGDCNGLSLVGAIIEVSQLGLEPGATLGHVHLIPYGKECTVIIGYKGMIELARRSGQILSISARVVHENDKFEHSFGLEEKLVHTPADKDRGEITHVYSVAKLVGGGSQFEVMSVEEINKIRDMKKYRNKVWDEHYSEMARKTAVRRLFKYLPTSIEINRAQELDSLADEGLQQGNQQVIDATFVPSYQSKDATTVSEINAEDAETSKAEAVKRFNGAVAKAEEVGAKKEEIMKELGVNAFDDLLSGPVDKIHAAIEVLADFT